MKIKQGSMQEKLYKALPIYPAKPITREILAKELGITSRQLISIISALSPYLYIYEDFGEIGRLR